MSGPVFGWLVRALFNGFVAGLERKGRERRRALYMRCNRVINAETVAKFPRIEPLLCNRPINHLGACCGCESACDYDEHNDSCWCLSFTDFGNGRCKCGGFKR